MDAYFWIIAVLGVVSTLICLYAGIAAKKPNDITLGSVALVFVGIVIYLVGAIVGTILGQQPRGEGWEFWGYMITALVIPLGAGYWSVVERTRWSNFVLAVVGVTVLVMAARMNQIWY